MGRHVIFGAGPIGTATALELAAAGESVIIASRSGSGPEDGNITRAVIDASDADSVARTAVGATAIYNCLNPSYTRWATDWPPMASALLSAARSSGAVYVICSNLYGYGPVDGPIRADAPLAAAGVKGRVRAKMWEDALAAHNNGDVRAVEVRSSDYIGPDAESHLGDRIMPKLLTGKGVRVVGNPDVPHSWTYTRDAARTMVAVASEPQAWGRAWHTPTNAPRTQRDAIADLALASGVPNIPVKGMSRGTINAVGLFVPMVRELKETYYQFDAPFVIDDSETRTRLGLGPTGWETVINEQVAPFLRAASKVDAAA